ncbi:MAG TPA: LAGLIDADG family homing endonuclease, partial [Candidatus Dormibacteraeota bacterium]|nr:LAGLIDADG family homing endonuclease [Candidatus Dormibacteraeota bacterium]
MKFARLYSTAGEPYAGVAFEPRTSRIVNPNGSVIFEAENMMVPASWSQVATDVLAQKYCRKAGVPMRRKRVEEPGVPEWLWRSVPDEEALAALPRNEQFGAEMDARDVFNRLAGCWTYWAWKHDYFDSEEDARTYYDEMCVMLARQVGAPNSPQWFNTGLHWAYGISGPAQGHYFVDPRTTELTRSTSAYEHPAPHACFIQSVADDLVNEGGIMDLWVREARIFKYGSGCVSERAFIPVSGRGLMRIGELYAEMSRHRPVHNFDGKGRYIEIGDLGLKTLSLDKESGRIVEDGIDRVWSYSVAKEDKVAVKFDTGARATVSAWHPFMVWDGESIVERRADSLRTGDAVIGPNSTSRRLVNLREPIPEISYSYSRYRSASVATVTVDEDIAWLIGYFLGDGSLDERQSRVDRSYGSYYYRRLRLRFYDEDRAPLEKVARILLERFGAKCAIQVENRVSAPTKCLSLTCTRLAASEFFASAVHTPGSKTYSLEVPSFIKNAPATIQEAFLAGLIDSDGTAQGGRATYTSVCKPFAEEVAGIASLLGLGGGIVFNGGYHSVTVVRRSASTRSRAAILANLATPKHVAALERDDERGRRQYCLPVAPDLAQKLFPERDQYGLHGTSGNRSFHVGRLVYEGIINPQKILAAIAAKPESEIDADIERLRLVAEGVAFVTDVSQLEEDVAFNDLTTQSTNTYLAGERGLVVIHNSGSNFSHIRGAGERLSGGGTSSGIMSFLRIGDRAAGAIKSGGTTRRAAKMVVLNADHPDIEQFVSWKVTEEQKVADLVVGSMLCERKLNAIMKAANAADVPEQARLDPQLNAGLRTALRDALVAGVPQGNIAQALDYAKQGYTSMTIPTYDVNWDGEAYGTVSGQNSNNTVRL